MIHLTKEYLICRDKIFHTCIKDIVVRDKDNPHSNLNPNLLIVRATSKYNTLA